MSVKSEAGLPGSDTFGLMQLHCCAFYLCLVETRMAKIYR